MRLLLDERVPHDLEPHLVGYEIATVAGVGWAGLKNGALLRQAAEAGFDVLVTMDRNLEHQQNLSTSSLGFVLLLARSTRPEDVVPMAPAILIALRECRPGRLVRVGNERRAG